MCRDSGCDCIAASSSSAIGRSKSSRPQPPRSAFSSSPLTRSDQPPKSRSKDDKSSPYSYDLLRSDPTTGHLKHLASSGHSPLFRRNPRQNPASDPILPTTSRDHKDVPTMKRTTDPNSTSYSNPYSYPTHAYHDGYRQDKLKSGLHLQDPPYRPRSLSSSDAGDVQYPYSLDKHYPHHYGASSGQREEDDGEMDDYHDGKAMAVDGSLGLDALGRKHVCPTCFKRFNRPSSLRIHLNTHTGATRKYPLWVLFMPIPSIYVWFSLAFKCPWPNCGREFNVNSNMRRHYRNHISPARSQAMSIHSASHHFQMDPNEVPTVVRPPSANHDIYDPPSVHKPPHVLVSTSEGQNSVYHGSSTSSSSGEMYHANLNPYQRELERKQERNRKKHIFPDGLDLYYRGATAVQHEHHQKSFLSGQDISAMDLDHMDSKYAPMPSPPSSQSSLSDADHGSSLHMDMKRDKQLQPRSRHPQLTRPLAQSESSRPSSCLHQQPAPTSMHCEDELNGDQINSHHRSPPSQLRQSYYEQPGYSSSNSSLALSRTSSPEEQGHHLSTSPSRPKYNPSKPYLESLKDSRVSTTLRPAFK